jgi:hypothetical protein
VPRIPETGPQILDAMTLRELRALRSPWVLDWSKVVELFLAQMRERERREREALAFGINCRLRRDAK